MSEEIKNLTYNRNELERLSFSMLCNLNNISTTYAYSISLTKAILIEFLLTPNN